MQGITEIEIAAGQLGSTDRFARAALERALAGVAIDDRQALHLLELSDEHTPALLAVAGHVRTARKGRTVTYSPKVFLPVTNLCLDRCSYCTFRQDPDEPGAWTMLPEDVRACCHAGRARGCIEALMCLGDKPERAYRSYRQTLGVLGHETTIDYVAACCAIALDEGMLPHTNAGLLSRDEMQQLKPLNVSLGLMLESVSTRLRRRGGAHHQAPDKDPALRLAMIETAGALQIAFTTGILLGIGETLAERVDSLRAIGEAHAAHGHIQEIIVQNFRAKPTTRMASAPEPNSFDTARTIAVARLMLPALNIQAPPNLSPYDHRLFLAAGINDWGGISPLTLDYVNPEAPWPQVQALARTCAEEGFTLAPRLPIYSEYVDRPGFLDPSLRAPVAAHAAAVTPAAAPSAAKGVHHVG
jgi:7,8-didemethyl-8-hydroxy-5-deazariboflavin synthase CofG subunit